MMMMERCKEEGQVNKWGLTNQLNRALQQLTMPVLIIVLLIKSDEMFVILKKFRSQMKMISKVA